MNKRLLVLAVAGAFGASGSAFADSDGNLSVKGYVESIFVVSQDEIDEDELTNERRFDTEGSLAFRAMTDGFYAGVVLDVNSRYSGYEAIEIVEPHLYGGRDPDEQNLIEVPELWGGWHINDMAGIRIGRFENPLGYESQKAPKKTMISRGLITELLDGQTSLYKNTVEGLALDLDVGPAKLTLGVLNEIGDVQEENSFLAHISGEVVPGLNLALGLLTQEDFDAADNPTSFESLINFNAAYKFDLGGMASKVWIDYLTAGEILDNAWSVGFSIQPTSQFDVAFRYDMAKGDYPTIAGELERTSMTLAGLWRATDRVGIRAEWRNDDFDYDGGDFDDDYNQILLSAVFSY